MMVDSTSHLLFDDKNDMQYTNQIREETSNQSLNKSLSVNNNNFESIPTHPAIIPLKDYYEQNRENVITVKNNKRTTKQWILLAILLISIIFVGILILIITKASSKQKSSVIPAKKVLFIIVDGIPADVIEKANVPNLKRIGQIGKYKRAYVGGESRTYTETPTISAPGYMNLITGTWLNKHNVSNNNVEKPNYNYKNIFRLLKEQQPSKKIGIFSTWTDNRVKLVGEGLSQAGNIIFDYKFDGYEIDLINYPHDPLSLFIQTIDQRVVNETSTCVKNNAPDLSWVYLEYTDDIAHAYGDSPQFYQSITDIDQQIGQIYDAIEYRMKYHREDWLIIVTTDHGRDSSTGKDHGYQTERERTTWLVINKPEVNIYFQQFVPAIVDILPTMARFINLTIPLESERELDGVPLIGNVSLVKPDLTLINDNLTITWKTLDTIGNVVIWLSTTNLYKYGSQDNYILIGMVPIQNQIVTYNIRDYPSNFYKIVLEGKYNMVNKWIFRP